MHRGPSLAALAVTTLTALLIAPPGAAAHGLVGDTDLPVPQWLFAWAAAIVLVASFLALGALWSSPRLERDDARREWRIPVPVQVACGLVGFAFFALVVVAALAGTTEPTDNLAPTAVYVLFWVVIALASAAFGDLFALFSPWRSVGRAAEALGLRRVLPVREYPARLGQWPAALTILAFGWLELVSVDGQSPRVLGVLALLYLVVQLGGQALWGSRAWSRNGDGFGALFALFARLSPLDWDTDRVRLRRRPSGLSALRPTSGTVALLCVSLGVTTFDGVSGGPAWGSTGRAVAQDLIDGGMGPALAHQLTGTIGILLAIALVVGVYQLGVRGMVGVARGRRTHDELSRAFVHSLVPIALAYVLAHYFSFVVFQGQALPALLSDPLGDGADLLGAADWTIDRGAVSPDVIWYVQTVTLIVGHVGGLVLAHDRALTVFRRPRAVLRSQYWMLAVMVGFTSVGLWLLSSVGT
ncbi:MAG: fenitrothion hydrolase [Solirubrobacteraceae bacterium]|nr:fenitrothion hydrolase [Solirubrobacteraceae bacterium]